MALKRKLGSPRKQTMRYPRLYSITVFTNKWREDGEVESHFHLYLALRDREALLEKLKEAGVIVRMDGPYASFLDPDGRTIKLSEDVAVLA